MTDQLPAEAAEASSRRLDTAERDLLARYVQAFERYEVVADSRIPDDEVHLVSGDSRTVIPLAPTPETERVVFGQLHAVTALELAGHAGRGVMLDRIVARLERQLGDAVEERGAPFSSMRVRYEIRATYTATVPKRLKENE